jgi:hypothetical protein
VSEVVPGRLAGWKRKAVCGKTRKEAAEKLTKTLADRDIGLVFEGENRTLAAFLDGWLDGTVKGSVKATTYESYERLIRCHIKPKLRRRKLKTLAPITFRPSTSVSWTPGWLRAQFGKFTPY